VLAAAKSAGMNVPYDLSIAGFEDSPFSKQSWPPLTTAKQATEDIARQAARLLIARLRQDAYADTPIALHNQGFTPQLVVRGSTAPVRPARAEAKTQSP
jgi:LacI family transcriptional regulator